MKLNRRHFIESSLATGAILGLGNQLIARSNKADKPLDILFLGGTGFIGPHMVRHCLARGHKITLFNRGKSASKLFPELETVIGNRDPKIDQGLDGLKNRKWDVVIDTSGYVPRHVDGSAALLSKVAAHYLYISTVAVYADFSNSEMDEDSPQARIDDPSIEKVTGETYGPLKALCEKKVLNYFPDTATILRPTYIVGPGDHTDRFIHYLDRPLQGDRMVMPGAPSNPISYVDVRDLADHVVRSVENVNPGIYNMVNKPRSSTFGELMNHSMALSKSKSEIIWLNTDFLSRQEETNKGVFGPFPMWTNPDNKESLGFANNSQQRAIKNGFSNRPFRETVIDTFNWWMQQTVDRRKNKRVTLTTKLEQKLLSAWDKEQAEKKS